MRTFLVALALLSAPAAAQLEEPDRPLADQRQEAAAKAIMADIGISESRRVRGLGPHQIAKLVEQFG